MYAFIGVDKDKIQGFDDHEFALHLLETEHVLVAPGSSFNVDYNNYIRVTILPEAQVITDVFASIGSALESYKK